MIFGFLDVSMTPKTNYFYLWRPMHSKYAKNDPKALNKLFPKSHCSTTVILNMLEIRVPKHLEDPSNKFLRILNMGSISSRKHEMDIG